MSLEAAVHARWASYQPLTSLIPAASFRTMWMADDEIDLPYAVMTREGEPRNSRASNGLTISTRTLRFAAFADTLDEVKKIGDAIDDRFNRADFSYSGDHGQVYDMMRRDRDETKDDDGTYIVVIDYAVQTGEYV